MRVKVKFLSIFAVVFLTCVFFYISYRTIESLPSTDNVIKRNISPYQIVIADEELFDVPPKTSFDPYKDLERIALEANEIARQEIRWNPTLGEMLGIEIGESSTLWDQFHLRIARDELYPENDDIVPALLKHATTAPIANIALKGGGTQIKLTVNFVDGGRALFKPLRSSKNSTILNHFYFNDVERYTAEIATFHLDRLLGFRHCAPVVGRKLNITKDIYPFAKDHLLDSFYVSSEKNICFYGKCSQYCDPKHSVCGNPDIIEGAMVIYLPSKQLVHMSSLDSPWRRSYNYRRKVQWELDRRYCDLVKSIRHFTEGRRLLDLIDLSILDFLIGNWDRHGFDYYRLFGDDSALVVYDNGRAFGKPYEDIRSALAPLYQCCRIRHSTVLKLLSFQNEEPLSERMRKSLSDDPLSPILTEPHLIALDRRVDSILSEVRMCILKTKNPLNVIINDFH